jgi:hypothetical protein
LLDKKRHCHGICDERIPLRFQSILFSEVIYLPSRRHTTLVKISRRVVTPESDSLASHAPRP